MFPPPPPKVLTSTHTRDQSGIHCTFTYIHVHVDGLKTKKKKFTPVEVYSKIKGGFQTPGYGQQLYYYYGD